VPRIIDYPAVLKTLTAQGMRCNYPSGGAFGYGAEAGALVRGWIGPDDQTIRPDMRATARQIPAPFEANLARLACAAWQTHLPGPLWLMPASHWAFEMQHGNGQMLTDLIKITGLESARLSQLADASAIEFSLAELSEFGQFAQRLLEGLTGSDFVMAFSERQTICTLHHHKQLWWTTRDAIALAGLDAMLSAIAIL